MFGFPTFRLRRTGESSRESSHAFASSSFNAFSSIGSGVSELDGEAEGVAIGEMVGLGVGCETPPSFSVGDGVTVGSEEEELLFESLVGDGVGDSAGLSEGLGVSLS